MLIKVRFSKFRKIFGHKIQKFFNNFINLRLILVSFEFLYTSSYQITTDILYFISGYNGNNLMILLIFFTYFAYILTSLKIFITPAIRVRGRCITSFLSTFLPFNRIKTIGELIIHLPCNKLRIIAHSFGSNFIFCIGFLMWKFICQPYKVYFFVI